MKTGRVLLVCIALTAVIALSGVEAQGPTSTGEGTAPDKDFYNEDMVPVGDYEMPILVNKSSNRVEYYWSQNERRWIRAREFDGDLQHQYDNRKDIRQARQFRDMQKELDRMHEESWYGREDQPGR